MNALHHRVLERPIHHSVTGNLHFSAKRGRDDERFVMIPTTGQVADLDLGVRNPLDNQLADFFSRNRFRHATLTSAGCLGWLVLDLISLSFAAHDNDQAELLQAGFVDSQAKDKKRPICSVRALGLMRLLRKQTEHQKRRVQGRIISSAFLPRSTSRRRLHLW